MQSANPWRRQLAAQHKRVFNFNLISRPFRPSKLHFAVSIYPSSPGPLSPALVSSGSCSLGLPGCDFSIISTRYVAGRPVPTVLALGDLDAIAVISPRVEFLNVTIIATLASFLVRLIVVGGA